jgi:hypothetical protein
VAAFTIASAITDGEVARIRSTPSATAAAAFAYASGCGTLASSAFCPPGNRLEHGGLRRHGDDDRLVLQSVIQES